VNPGPSGRPLSLALIHMAFIGAVGIHILIPFLLPEGSRSDFGYFHQSAAEVVRGGSPYVAGSDGEVVVNLNSPFLTALMIPLGKMAYGRAMWLWYASSLAVGVIAGFVMARTFVRDRFILVWGPLLATGLLLYPPSLANAWLSQLGLVLALVAALTFLLVAENRWTAAGVVLGLAAGLKVFFGIFAILFLLTRRWRALAGFGAAFLGTLVLGGLMVGWETYPAWARLLGTVDWHSWSWNVSIFGTSTRLLGSSVSPGLVRAGSPVGLVMGTIAVAALAVGYGFLVVRRASGGDQGRAGLAVSLTFILMIVLSPLGWLYYLPALIPSCAYLITSSRPGGDRTLSVGCVAVFLVLSAVPQRPYAGTELLSPEYAWWKSEMPLLAMLVLAGGHVTRLVHTRQRKEGLADSG